ncbi:DUF1826 domain-containing protein [Roseomonas stagni]|uniref:DUF1826 domain-containing protein n=1 Tax=Falsiroseomonas algicola TaxID=2716930 RepID=A0A6M1LGD8_9PROT|nr:DUF1826 domain-containing protein [Falsiroseomonas algicola]NGM19074.1 DUF1826 domain-containing protein [Falsiroseomonas algicola]
MPLDLADSPSPLSAMAALAPVLRDGSNVAAWHRALPVCLFAGLTPLLARGPFVAIAEDAPDAALATLARNLPLPEMLRADIAALATTFAALVGQDRVRIRLEALRGRGCHRWHADAVGLRLLCTYAGPGTEWLDLTGGAALARRLDPAHLMMQPERLGTGDVAVLKGEAWPGNAGNGCIHRSPPNPDDAPLRLVLCLDEPGRFPAP